MIESIFLSISLASVCIVAFVGAEYHHYNQLFHNKPESTNKTERSRKKVRFIK
jgi:hypothetical protein